MCKEEYFWQLTSRKLLFLLTSILIRYVISSLAQLFIGVFKCLIFIIRYSQIASSFWKADNVMNSKFLLGDVLLLPAETWICSCCTLWYVYLWCKHLQYKYFNFCYLQQSNNSITKSYTVLQRIRQLKKSTIMALS